jgi:hypothetical protein
MIRQAIEHAELSIAHGDTVGMLQAYTALEKLE